MKIESPKNDLKPFLQLFNRFKPLKKLIKKNSIIFDVGANVGDSIDEFYNILKPKKIYGFEPQKSCVEKLVKRFKNKNIKILDCAVDIKSGKKVFYEDIEARNLSGFYKINTESKDHVDLRNRKRRKKNIKKYLSQINIKTYIKTISLDDFIDENKIKRINLMKLDTQGHEEKILKGIKKNINKVDIFLIEMMFWDYYEKKTDFYSIEKIIRKNFELYDISYVAKNPVNFRTDYIDVIYVNKRLKIKR